MFPVIVFMSIVPLKVLNMKMTVPNRFMNWFSVANWFANRYISPNQD